MIEKLDMEIQFLKGVGEKRAALYHRLSIDTLGDLLRHYPRSYLDLTAITPIASAPLDGTATLRARVVQKGREQHIRKGMSVFKVTVADESGSMVLTFYNAKYTVEAIKQDEEYLFHGRMGGNLIRREMSAPLVIRPGETSTLMPIYSLTAGLTSRGIAINVRQALRQTLEFLPETLPFPLRQKLGLCHIQYAIENIHQPESREAVELARRRLIFEELFTLSLALTRVKDQREIAAIEPLPAVELAPFYNALPYAPTGAQRRAVGEIATDLTGRRPMNRLLQGDVGSGKTLVAAAAAYYVIQAGGQAAMMAPTEILAEQHLRTLTSLLEGLGARVAILTGSMPAKEKTRVKKALVAGEVDFLIGTHALLSQGIEFLKLSLVITDEQHRFGVGQRIALGQKGETPHTLVMSATPIPRTLALIIYGDLDVSVLDEMPVGRLPVKTYRIDSSKRQRAFGFIKEHLDKGYQAYIVCPLVEENEEGMGNPNLIPATTYAEEIAQGAFASHKVGLLHGKMKGKDKDAVMRAFQGGEIQVLVATTVIEVGVDVPNAVIILIENAEQFGLSQLHQLRGRVGRGSVQSHCILLSDSRGEDSRVRLSAMCRTSSGFLIAEEDLSLRGPGDFFGSRQHGLPQLRIADMAQDMELLALAQESAQELLIEDPTLTSPLHTNLRGEVERMLHSVGERPN